MVHRNRVILRDVPRDEAMAPAIAYLKTKYKGLKFYWEIKPLILIDDAERLMSAAMILCRIPGIIQGAVDAWHGRVRHNSSTKPFSGSQPPETTGGKSSDHLPGRDEQEG